MEYFTPKNRNSTYIPQSAQNDASLEPPSCEMQQNMMHKIFHNTQRSSTTQTNTTTLQTIITVNMYTPHLQK